MMFYQKKESGFSLVETLVAISILLIVITGPMAISMRSAKSSSFSSEQIQAFFLAQEGLELAQKARDELLLRYFNGDITNPWGQFTNTSGTFANCFVTGVSTAGCGLQWSSTAGVLASPVSCSTVSNCLLYRASSGRSWFTHTSLGNESTIFTRRIYFTQNGNEVRVRSLVTWRTGSVVSEQRVEVETYLYNVYDTP